MAENEPSSDFLSQVRDALAHLFDAAHLQSHPLLDSLVPPEIADPKARAQILREAILQAISDLRPPAGVSPRDSGYRPYAVLRLKYAEGVSNEEVQDRLAISRRQFFREQQRACEAVANLLWERRPSGFAPGDYPEQALGEELEQLGLQPRPFPALALVEDAIAAVRGLADARGVAISVTATAKPVAFADQAIVSQVMVSLLSAVIQLRSGTYLEIKVESRHPSAVISLHLPGPPPPPETLEEHLSLPAGLALRAGARLETDNTNNSVRLRLHLPLARRDHVVIVDDNPKTLKLFQRYLEPYRYRVTAIQDSQTALDQIRALGPDAVVLDVMMRDVDGWRILQALKADPATAGIPVIVCSVLKEDELARAVGADAYLRKPISQSALVLALAQVQSG